MDWRLLAKYLEDESDRAPVHEEQELAVLPLANVVLIPGTVLPIRLLDEAHIRLVEEAVSMDHDIAVCFAPLGRDKRMMLSSVCGVGKVSIVDVASDGCRSVVVEGDYRVEILDMTTMDTYMRARVRFQPDLPDPSDVSPIIGRDAFLELVKRWLFLMGHVPMTYVQTLELFREAHQLADFIAAYFLPDYTFRQKMLETRNPMSRVTIIESILKKAILWLSEKPVPTWEFSAETEWVH